MRAHPLYIAACILFILHQLLQRVWSVPLPWADQFLDPLLCMPILLGLLQWEQRLLYRRRLRTGDYWLLTLVLALLFELVFPRLSSGFTADYRDALLYFAGTAGFLWVQQRTRQRIIS